MVSVVYTQVNNKVGLLFPSYYIAELRMNNAQVRRADRAARESSERVTILVESLAVG